MFAIGFWAFDVISCRNPLDFCSGFSLHCHQPKLYLQQQILSVTSSFSSVTLTVRSQISAPRVCGIVKDNLDCDGICHTNVSIQTLSCLSVLLCPALIAYMSYFPAITLIYNPHRPGCGDSSFPHSFRVKDLIPASAIRVCVWSSHVLPCHLGFLPLCDELASHPRPTTAFCLFCLW